MLRNPSRTAFNKDNWVQTATVVLIAGQYIEFGRFACPAGVAYALGYGLSEGQDSANGRVFIDLRDNSVSPGVVIAGQLRIEVLDPTDKTQKVIWEGRTEQVSGGSGDRTKQMPFPLIADAVGENYKFVFKVKPDAGATLGKANSTLLMDCTVYEDK